MHNTIIPKQWTKIPYLPSTMDILHEVPFKLQFKYNEYGHKYERYPTSSILAVFSVRVEDTLYAKGRYEVHKHPAILYADIKFYF